MWNFIVSQWITPIYHSARPIIAESVSSWLRQRQNRTCKKLGKWAAKPENHNATAGAAALVLAGSGLATYLIKTCLCALLWPPPPPPGQLDLFWARVNGVATEGWPRLGLRLASGYSSGRAWIPKRYAYKGRVQEQKKCVHLCLALFDFPATPADVERFNNIVEQHCVNPTHPDNGADQREYLRAYVLWLYRQWHEKRSTQSQPATNAKATKSTTDECERVGPEPDPEQYNLVLAKTNNSISINSGTLARVLDIGAAGIVELDADEAVYSKAINAYLVELASFAAHLQNNKASWHTVCTNPIARARVRSLVAPFLVPVRYWVPGKTPDGKRGFNIVGLHWKPFLEHHKEYEGIANLVTKLGTCDNADTAFPSKDEPNFLEKYALQRGCESEFSRVDTFRVDGKHEQKCDREPNIQECEHFCQKWWVLNPTLQ